MPIESTSSSNRNASQTLDLRSVPRPQRHPMIFATFDALAVGESMELVNDHDPIPLRMQIDRMRPGQARWEYLRRGPDLFHIRIRRVEPSADSDLPLQPPSPLTSIEHKH